VDLLKDNKKCQKVTQTLQYLWKIAPKMLKRKLKRLSAKKSKLKEIQLSTIAKTLFSVAENQ
jgi:hypothetical protein